MKLKKIIKDLINSAYYCYKEIPRDMKVAFLSLLLGLIPTFWIYNESIISQSVLSADILKIDRTARTLEIIMIDFKEKQETVNTKVLEYTAKTLTLMDGYDRANITEDVKIIAREVNLTSKSNYEIGLANLVLGDYEKALEYLAKATEENPNNAKAWWNMAVALKKLDRNYSEALNRAIDLDQTLRQQIKIGGSIFNGLKIRIEPQE
ncbi:MAG: tetratricopeptide repeat protein [Candidatus Buchananbacteria bacterium]